MARVYIMVRFKVRFTNRVSVRVRIHVWFMARVNVRVKVIFRVRVKFGLG